MVTLQILVLPFLVRVRVAQQRVSVMLKLFFCICGSPAPIKKGLTGKVWGLSKKLSDLGKESNKAKILLQ